MRTLDETIAQYQEKAEYFKMTTNVAYALELKQISEWLEELKAYKSDEFTKNLQELVYKQGYNKAIDDFVEKISIEISESIIYGMLVDSRKYNGFNDTSDKIVDYVIETSKNVAEQLKEDESE